MAASRLDLSAAQVVAHRRRAGGLDARLPPGPASLRRAAWAGLQDSTPRAALLSLHARVAQIGPGAWEDPTLVQLWGPRFSAYVVADVDRAVFTLGRLPDDAAGLRRAEAMADRLHAFLGGRRIAYGEAGHGIGVNPNALRYGAPTGRILIRWDGARQPTVWTVPPPEVNPRDARLELARRFLHLLGPATPAAFARWAGIRPPPARAAFEWLGEELVPVRTAAGHGWILASDEPSFRGPPGPGAPARLLPSGDASFLLWGADRAILVADAALRARLWTPRVWPGALLLGGEVAGTWRRADAEVTVQPWRSLGRGEREAVEAEAASLPLPGLERAIAVRWDG